MCYCAVRQSTGIHFLFHFDGILYSFIKLKKNESFCCLRLIVSTSVSNTILRFCVMETRVLVFNVHILSVMYMPPVEK